MVGIEPNQVLDRHQTSTNDAVVRHQDLGAAVAQHVLEAGGRIVDVERKIGTTGLQYREHRDDEIDGAFEADPDDDVRPDAEALEMVPQLVGTPVELGIAEGLAAADDSGGVRRAGSGGLDKLLHAVVGGKVGGGVVPGQNEPVLVGSVEQRQREDGGVRVGDSSRQEH